MANYNSLEYASILAPVRANALSAGKLNGRVQIKGFTVDPTGTYLNGDTINIAKMVSGERFIGGVLLNGILGASTTLSVGDAGSATRFLAATSTAAAAVTQLLAATGINYDFTADTVILLTVGGANLAASPVIQGYLLYVQD